MDTRPRDAAAVIAMSGLTIGAFSAFCPSVDACRDAPGKMSEVGTQLRGSQITAIGYILGTAGMASYLTRDWIYLFLAAVSIVVFVFVQENALKAGGM